MIACPRCKGAKMIDNGARDPQDGDDTECPRCNATGMIREPKPVDALTPDWRRVLDASIADAKHRRADEIDPEEARLLQQELAERDREWWA